MDQKVAEYFGKQKQWLSELELLRQILLECGLTEEYKWRVPCYLFNQTNIALINSFKEHAVLGFFKGALLKDEEKILIQQTENSQAARILKFKSTTEIEALRATIKSYIFEAIEVEKQGLKIAYKKEVEFAKELEEKLHSDAAFNKAFRALTPGRQRAYNLYFSAPKQEKTRISRIESYLDRIMKGKGINDCICGLSKRMPNCDGSHKILNQS